MIGIVLLSISSVSAISDGSSSMAADVDEGMASAISTDCCAGVDSQFIGIDSAQANGSLSCSDSNSDDQLLAADSTFDSQLLAADSTFDNQLMADESTGNNADLIADDSEGDDDDEDDEPKIIDTFLLDKNANHTFAYGNNFILQLVDNESNPLPYEEVSFTIKKGGTSYEDSQISDEKGRIYIPLKYKGGIWTVSAVFEGDDKYSAALFNATFTIYEKTSVAMPSYSFRGSSINIRFKTSTGKYIPNAKFTFIVNGVKYTKQTDSKGVFTFALPNKQYCRMKIIFEGSNYYLPCEHYIKMPVYVKTKVQNNNLFVLKGKKFAITLKNQYGGKLKHKTINFTIGGKTYAARTNKKGIAYLKIKISGGPHIVYYRYLGSSYYYKSSGSVVLTVIDGSKQRKNGLNQKGASIRAYLIGSGRCKVTPSIRKLARKLTKGYSSKLDKAGILMDYVANQVYYEYYANSRKGAHKTLKSKYGNCCDQASLLIALCRASNIPARYAHAQGCTFTSGLRTGHVWAQIKVGGMWYVADPTSYRNYLGKVNNWNTKSYYSLHKYSYIPF